MYLIRLVRKPWVIFNFQEKFWKKSLIENSSLLFANICELQRLIEFKNHKYEQMRSDLELPDKEVEKTKTENKVLKNEVLNLKNQVNN